MKRDVGRLLYLENKDEIVKYIFNLIDYSGDALFELNKNGLGIEYDYDKGLLTGQMAGYTFMLKILNEYDNILDFYMYLKRAERLKSKLHHAECMKRIRLLNEKQFDVSLVNSQGLTWYYSGGYMLGEIICYKTIFIYIFDMMSESTLFEYVNKNYSS